MKRAAILLLFALPAFAAEPSKFTLPSSGAAADPLTVLGPASVCPDNSLPRMDGATATKLQCSAATVEDSGNIPGTSGATVTVAASDSLLPVADFIADGTADEVTINAAIAALPAGGGNVLLGEGLYTIAAPIVSKSGMCLIGSGSGATTIRVVAGSAGGFAMIQGTANGTNVDVCVRDLELDANSRPNIYPLYFSTSSDATNGERISIERNYIHDGTSSSYGILTVGVKDLLIRDNVIEDFGDSVIELRATARATIEGNHLARGSFQFYGQTESGVTMSDLVVVGNTFVDCNLVTTNGGSRIARYQYVGNSWRSTGTNVNANYRYTDDLLVMGNVFDATAITTTTGALIVLESTTDNALLAQNVIKAGTYYVQFEDTYGRGAISVASTDTRLVGNTILAEGEGGYCIKATTATSRLEVSGNRCQMLIAETTSVGINLAVTAGAIVSGNVLDGAYTGVAVAASSSGTKLGKNIMVSSTVPYSIADTTATSDEPSYGEIYETGGSTAITVTAAGTYYQWATTTTGLASSDVTVSAASDDITISQPGVYRLTAGCSFSGSANALVKFAVHEEGTIQTNCIASRKVSAGGDAGRGAISCLVAGVANDSYTLRFTSDTNGDTVTPTECALNVQRVGS